MKRLILLTSCFSLALTIAGCGSKTEVSKTSEYHPERPSESNDSSDQVSVVSTADLAEASPATTGSAVSPATLSPREVVTKYIAALQDDDYRSAEDLLTQAARDAFYQSRLQPSLPGSSDARVEIAEVRYATQKQERGYVETVWNESDEQGQAASYSVDVYVRQEVPGEWRVAGLMMGVDKDEFVFFNFEDVADMMAKNQGSTDGPEVREANAGGGTIR